MRNFLAYLLVVIGAFFGGVFPGSGLAFTVACGTRMSGIAGEFICFATNLAFGVAGAFCGNVATRTIKPDATRFSYLLFPIVSGVIAGVAGYFWFDWALSHAEPPL
jgi:hypothetical protein